MYDFNSGEIPEGLEQELYLIMVRRYQRKKEQDIEVRVSQAKTGYLMSLVSLQWSHYNRVSLQYTFL